MGSIADSSSSSMPLLPMDLTYTAIILASLLVGVLANPGVSRMWWQDERLNFTANHTSYNCVELDVNQMRAVWEPDLYFSNELQGATHKITSSNRLMHLFKNGTIVFSIRLVPIWKE
ncbi:GLRA4-like protein [Mya arenaria]|uniref:GLRA4-like protein n=1 Tax=Mya arenaria TaxID=6604 RepID=A0ABY7DPF3_MYAAR|nr:GLRA4-like protein [Mya arenaria]